MKELIDNGAFLVDVRTPSEFAEGHVEQSINIPLDTIEQNIQKFKDKNHVLVFCRSGNRSAHAKIILEQHGIKNVTNGGTWQDVLSFVK
jgi:rhodanese-related sulfurtransferase